MYVYPLSSPAIAVVDNEGQRILEYSPHGPLVLLTLSQSSLTAPCALFHVLSSMFCSEVLLGCCFYCDCDIRRAGVFHFHSIVKISSIKSKHPMQNGHMRICQCWNHAWICWILNWIDQPVGCYFMIAFSLMLQISHSAMVSFDVSHHRTRIDIIIWNSLGEAELGRSVAVIFYELLWAA